MDNLVVGKINALISRLERMRANYYPADWDADPLYDIICELREIAAETPGKSEASSSQQVETANK